ncbi:hypothetical protein C8R46DRAFT_1222462 [Mycena filopes]|nr:hypothetical protein C8R46DRAFT_1222462 [Mycena filopes]
MSELIERLYCAKDLVGKTKTELTKIIQGQRDKWPDSTFNPSKVKRDQMVDGILKNGFTTQAPQEIEDDEAPQPSEPGEDSVRANSPPAAELRSLELFIEDLRDGNKFIQALDVNSVENLMTAEWLVDARELILALQRSPASLVGPVKIAVEDPKNPDWKRYFVKVTGNDSLEDASPSPTQLVVPVESQLKLFVEHSELNVPQRKRGRLLSDDEDEDKPLVSGAPATKKRAAYADQHDVDWLKELLLDRPGSSAFSGNRSKKLTNKARVSFWRFAAEFADAYFNKPSGAKGKQGNVKKASVEAALGMSASALTQAQKMTNIIKVFGAGGQKCAQEVVHEVQTENSTDGGALVKFLEEWNKSHSDE